MFYIYHVPGIKIGCTHEYPKRCLDQGFEQFELLETHQDGWLAGDREQILQAEYGYRVDRVHYMVSLQNRPKGPRSIESRIKQSITSKGKLKGKQSEEHKAKLSAATKGIPQIKYTCPHCNKLIGGLGNLNMHITSKH